MKLPNNYGAISKLPGNRRKPWAVRINVSGQKPKYIGYAATKEEALQMLAEYHRDPIDLERKNITFEEVYKYASEEHYPTIRPNTVKSLKSAYNSLSCFYKRKFTELKLIDYQAYFDTYPNGSGSATIIIRLLNMLYKYAIKYEIVNKSPVQYISLNQIKEREKAEGKEELHKRYSTAEVDELWEKADDIWVRVQLVMIYTGMRISELHDVCCNGWVDTENRVIDIKKSKTKSGIRKVPLSNKIVGIINPVENFLRTKSLESFKVTYSKSVIRPSHDCRYTFVSMLSDMLIDERIINELVGHTQQGLTNSVYMNLDFSVLRETVDRL